MIAFNRREDVGEGKEEKMVELKEPLLRLPDSDSDDTTDEEDTSTSYDQERLLVDCPGRFVGDYSAWMRQQIWLRLKDAETHTHTILVSGWKGVGKSRIMKQVMGEAKHQQPPFFGVVVRARMPGAEGPGQKMQMTIDKLKKRDEATKAVRRIEKAIEEQTMTWRWKVQRQIAQALKIDQRGDFTPHEMKKKIVTALKNQRFLLILEDVWERVNLKTIGVPTPSNGSKIIITSRSGKGIRNMVRPEEGKGEDKEELSKEEVWALFRDESIDVAANLPNYSGLLTGNIVLECFYCASLFCSRERKPANRLIEYWRLEGFMDDLLQRSLTEEEETTIRTFGDALLKELTKRCMLLLIPVRSLYTLIYEFGFTSVEQFVEHYLLEGLSSDYYVHVESHIRDMIDSRRYFVSFDSSYKGALEAPNLEEIERISLFLEDDIDRLLQKTDCPSPNCPKLSTLILDYPLPHRLRVIPDLFFQYMPLLRILHLNHLCITSLSSSISCLHNLLSLELKNSGDLEALPSFSQVWEKLQVFDLEGTTVRKIEKASFQDMQFVRRVDISGASNLTNLSFRGCRSLQYFEIGSQPDLEVLDLSGTRIAKFPYEMRYLEKLRYLYLSDIKIRDGRFHTIRFTYKHVYAQTKAQHYSLSYENHLEISGGNNYPYGIGWALSTKESLHIHDNSFIERVSKMDMKSLKKLRYCWIERCSRLESIVVVQDRNVDAFNSLETLQVSDAAKLTIVFNGKLGSGSFASLKHIHLHLCPKLVYCFSSIICLGQLESLEIKFCARLKKVLEEDNEEDQIVFPSLKRICLWKLPKLQSICCGNLPNLEELKVGGCSKLKKLPLQVNRNSSAAPLKIRGEEKWWANINGDGGIKQQPHIIFKPARPFKFKK